MHLRQRHRAARFMLSIVLVGMAGSCQHPVHTTETVTATGSPTAAPTLPVTLRPTHPPLARYVPPAQRLGHDQVRALLPGPDRLSADSILRDHAVPFAPAVTVDPDHAAGMPVIQHGRFALPAAGLDALRAQGFAFAPGQSFPNFMTGYAMIYIADQPVYVTGDAILEALHLSFDSMITDVESDALRPALATALAGLRAGLTSPSGSALTTETRADLDVYLAVALGLLQGTRVTTLAGGSQSDVDAIVANAMHATGPGAATVFGSTRDVDFSQFRPRGHYAGVPERERYFRAMIWLGREGLRLVDTVEGRAVLRRRGVAGALGLRAIASTETRRALGVIDDAVAGFAGEPEALTMRECDALDAEITRAGGLARISDADLLRAIDTLRGERPRVATSLLHHPDGAREPSPEPVALSLSPQRYTPDAMVLSRVSFDRVAGGQVPRMMPDALDAAYGALGNDQAVALLAPELHRFDYATELETARVLVDAHEAGYWQGSMYAAWLNALRSLSPRETLADSNTLPAVMTTDAWGRRMLNTQMAAWAELRHDLVLYTAESMSATPGCSYPDAYVEPYPAFWSALGQWVARGRAMVSSVPWQTPATRTRWENWLGRADSVVQHLGEMAERERTGQALTSAQLAYINQALNAHEQNVICTTVTTVDAGWYYDLFEPRLQLGEARSVAASVHTQPADAAGNPVGNVLHVGTGSPQELVVVVGAPGHQRAYVGMASAYLERVTTNFDRLTDNRWRDEIAQAHAPAWLTPVLNAPR